MYLGDINDKALIGDTKKHSLSRGNYDHSAIRLEQSEQNKIWGTLKRGSQSRAKSV